MSYFAHTKADLEAAREEAIRSLVSRLDAAVLDTAAKMDNPDLYDRTYVTEDLLARVVEVIAPHLTEPPTEWMNHRYAYPEMLVPEPSGIVRPYVNATIPAAVVAESEQALTEVRHPYDPGFTGNTCEAMTMRRGFGEPCGRGYEHPVHRVEE